MRSAVSVGCYEEEFRVIEELEEAYAPVEKFQRMKAVLLPDGTYQAVTEEGPVRTIDPQERRANEIPETYVYTGDKGYNIKRLRELPRSFKLEKTNLIQSNS